MHIDSFAIAHIEYVELFVSLESEYKSAFKLLFTFNQVLVSTVVVIVRCCFALSMKLNNIIVSVSFFAITNIYSMYLRKYAFIHSIQSFIHNAILHVS